ncbi:MAG: hypothetical protein KAW09_11325 [Thermoplasmata archaeon]|nr:hypothetical protein [Thermoplasmata archaeon]
MEKDFDYFLQCLVKSGGKMDEHYLKLDVAGAEDPAHRERLYCYELYHQLRALLCSGFPFRLNGEVDKDGHPIIHAKLGAVKPDMIVHVPGRMDRNLVAIEVKSAFAARDISGIIEDLKKLKNLIAEAQYLRGILLIFGDGQVDLPGRVRITVKDFSDDQILFVWHSGPETEMVVI